MQQVFGQYGYVGRLGGEEFGARLPNIPRAQMKLLLTTLMTKLHAKGFIADGKHLRPTMSFGVVTVDPRLPVANMMRAADQALYAAKNRGRDQFVFAEELDARAIRAA